uniref:Uncharacterized protein n=1 Tax=Anopheles coluzzii TaxID=1518534 RepID=A0A8W7PMF9_ANOCL
MDFEALIGISQQREILKCPERPGVIINTIKCNLISGPGLGYHKRIIRDRNPARASPRCRLLWLLEEHHGDDQRGDVSAPVNQNILDSKRLALPRQRIVSTTVSNDQR